MPRMLLGCCCALALMCGVVVGEPSLAQSPLHNNASEEAAQQIAEVLSQPLHRRLSYEPEQLDIVLAEIEEEYNIPIVFDKAALDEVAISPEAEVSIDVDNISLRAALNLMFKEPGLEDLCYLIEDEVLLITTNDTAYASTYARVYRVDDLLMSSPSRFNDTSAGVDPENLIDLLISTIEPNSWAENGTGDGEIQYLAPGMLVVSQTQKIHQEIAALLERMRVTKREILQSNTSAQSSPVAATQGFVLDVEFGENAAQEQQHLSEAIKRSVHWSGASTGNAKDVWIKVLPDRLLVRHVPVVLVQVETVLWDMNVLDRKRHRRGGGGLGCTPLTDTASTTASPALAEDAAAGDDGC